MAPTSSINLLIFWTSAAVTFADEPKLGVILSTSNENVEYLVTSVFSRSTKAFSSSNISLHFIQPPNNATSAFAILAQVCPTSTELSVAITYLSCNEDKVVTGFLAASSIPHVSITPSCDDVMTPWTLRIQPNRRYIYDVLYDIMVYEKIKIFMLVHDNSTDYTMLNKFIRKFSSSTTAAKLLDIEMFSLDPLLRDLGNYLSSHDVIPVIVLVLNCYNTIKTLSLAEKLQLTETKLRWVVANDEVLYEAYKTDVWKNGNIIFVQNHYTPRKISPCNSVVLNNTVIMWENKTLEQQYLSDAILAVTAALNDLEPRDLVTLKNVSCWFSPNDRKISASKQPSIDPVYAAIEQKINGKDGYSTDVEYLIRGIDSNWLSGQMHSVTTATWTPSGGLHLLREELFTETYNNFEGLPLRVVISFSEPYAYYCDENISGANFSVFCGLCVRILNEMARILNFTVDPIINKGPTGALDEDGNWNGMVATVMSEQVDLAVGPTSVTYDRSKVVGFTTSFTEDPAAILLRKARPSSVFRIFTPFSVATWILVIVPIVLLPVLLWLVELNSPLRGGGLYSEERRPPQSLNDVMWQFFTTYCLQGGDYRHRSLSGRSLVVFWVLFSIIINSIYTAILTAILTVSTDFAPISNLNDLADSPQYTPLVLHGSNLQSIFKNANEGSTYAKIWERLKDQTLPTTVSEAVERMRHDEYLAFMSDRSVLQYLLTEPDYCHEFVLAAESFNPTGLAFMVPIGAPYQTQLSKIISHLQEGGFIDKWYDNLWRINPECVANADGATSVTDIQSISGAFVVILASLGAGIALLALEKLASRFKSDILSSAYTIKWGQPVSKLGKKRNASESFMDNTSNVTEVTSQGTNGSRLDLHSIRSRKVTDACYTTHM